MFTLTTSLSSKKKKIKYVLQIRNNNAPSYLCDCLLPFERKENAYNLRNQTDYSNPFTRLQLYRNSFFLLRSNFGTI
jgi:hypothetical protein